MISLDVPTACHLGLCAKVRMSEAVPLVNSEETKFSAEALSVREAVKNNLF